MWSACLGLTLLWIRSVLAEDYDNMKITLFSGEVMYVDFLKCYDLSKGQALNIEQSSPGLTRKNNFTSLVFEKLWSKNLSTLQNNATSDRFTAAKCFLEPLGSGYIANIIFERNSTNLPSGQSKFFLDIKQITLNKNDTSNISFHALSASISDKSQIDLANFGTPTTSCRHPIFYSEFSRILLICNAQTSNQFLVMSVCSDGSCSEQTATLRIKEYIREAGFNFIRFLKIPGITESTYSVLIWMEGLPFLEYVLLDNFGNIESEVFRLDFNITSVTYHGGQMLVIETFLNNVQTYYYIMYDFGSKRVDFEKTTPKKMTNFGQAINSFVSSITGDVVIQLLADKLLIDLSLERQLDEFLVEYSKKVFTESEPAISGKNISISAMAGDFQLMTISNNTQINYLTGFKIMNRFYVWKAGEDFPFGNIDPHWETVSGMNILTGCDVTLVSRPDNSTQDYFLDLVQTYFEEPFMQINSSYATANGSSNMVSLKTKDDLTAFTFNYSVLPQSEFRIGWKSTPSNILNVTSATLKTDESYPLRFVMRGNFMCLMSAVSSLGNKFEFSGRINPLLNYKTIFTTKDGKQIELDSANSIVSFTTIFKFNHVFEVLSKNDQWSTLSIFQSRGSQIEKLRTEISRIKFDYFELFNETVVVAHSDQGLYMYDSEKNLLRELLFDAGKCDDILLIKNPNLDITLWCFGNNTSSAYNARDVIEGRAGIRKLSLVLENDFNFTDRIFKYNEYFPDYIFIIGKDSVLEVTKIECKSYVSLRSVAKIQLGKMRPDISTLDFEMSDRYLVLYQTQRIGYGNRILLMFYFMESPIQIVSTKELELDYKFSPNFKSKSLYRIESKRKYGSGGVKYSSNPMLAFKVKYMEEFENILFIDPRAPMSETIPIPLVSLGSKITKIVLGKCIFTNEMYIKSSIILYYRFMDAGRNRSSLMKIEEKDPSVKLSSILDSNFFYGKRKTQEKEVFTQLQFDPDYVTDSPEVGNITVNYIDSLVDKQSLSDTVAFKTLDLVIDLEQMKVAQSKSVPSTSGEAVDLYWLIPTHNLTIGNVFNWSMILESSLDQSSDIVKFNSLVRNRQLPVAKSQSISSFRTSTSNCSIARRDYLSLNILNETRTVPVDIWICLNLFEMIMRLKIYDKTGVIDLSYSRPNNLLAANPEYLSVYTNGAVLEISCMRKANGRQVFTDFYLVQAELKLEGLYSFTLLEMNRKFFDETVKDYLVRPRISVTYPYDTFYEFVEWSIVKNVSKSYNVTVKWQYWYILPQNQTGKVNLDIRGNFQLNLAIPEDLYGMKNKIDIYDEFSVKVLDKNDGTYLWFLIEHPIYHSYIIRYERHKIMMLLDANTKPDVWRVSNPFYGFESSYDIKSQKSDWAMVSFKIFGDSSYMLLYEVPAEVFNSHPTTLETIYIKEGLLLERVIDFRIEKPLIAPSNLS